MNSMLLGRLLKRMDGRKEAREEVVEVWSPRASGPEYCVLVFDRSGSMLCNDYSPCRILAALDSGLEFVYAKLQARCPDTIGIVLFDDEARVVCREVSLDEAIKILRNLKADPSVIGGGTDIKVGLLAAENLFQKVANERRKRLILLTDGHGGEPVPTGKRLQADGVLVDVIGVAGSPAAVAEAELRQVASVINGANRYRFIGNRAELLQHFRTIATDLIQVK